MSYNLFNVDADIVKSINIAVRTMCKENKINYERQSYKILFSNETLFVKNNGIKFTSGSKRYLCFYGKIYSNKKGIITESVYLKDNTVVLKPKLDSALIISGGINNSSMVDNDENLLHFYVAPETLLGLQHPDSWQTL